MNGSRQPVDPGALLKLQLREERCHFMRGIVWVSGAVVVGAVAAVVFLHADQQVKLLAGEPYKAERWIARGWLAIAGGMIGFGICSLGFLVEWTRWLLAMKERKATGGRQ